MNFIFTEILGKPGATTSGTVLHRLDTQNTSVKSVPWTTLAKTYWLLCPAGTAMD